MEFTKPQQNVIISIFSQNTEQYIFIVNYQHNFMLGRDVKGMKECQE